MCLKHANQSFIVLHCYLLEYRLLHTTMYVTSKVDVHKRLNSKERNSSLLNLGIIPITHDEL
jgi:hypothetical protein